MKITEKQAELILGAFSYMHDEREMCDEEREVCKEILDNFPALGKHTKMVEIEDKGFFLLIGETMKITEKQARIILHSFLCHGRLFPNEVDLCREIMESFPQLNKIIEMSGVKI